jgi:polysaccharide biosynthesis transport protein
MPEGPERLLPNPFVAPSTAVSPFQGGYELPPDDDEEGGGSNFGRYVSAILRHKWLILGLSVLGLAAGAGVSQFAKPVYEAQATIQVAGSRRESSSPIQATRLFEARGWTEIARSFVVLDEVVRRRRLFIRPEVPADTIFLRGLTLAQQFTPGDYLLSSEAGGTRVALSSPTGGVIESVAVGDSIGRSVGFLWAPEAAPGAGTSVAFRLVPPRDAAVALSNALEITPPPQDGSLLRIQLRGTDPGDIAATLNAVSDRFVEVATQLKRENLTAITEILNAQLARSAADVRAAEGALEGFRVTTITLPNDRGATPIAAGLVSTRDPVFDAFFQLKLERDALVNDRDAIARALRLPRDSTAALVVALGTIPAIRSSTELTGALNDLGARRAEARRMALQYTSEHPPLRQLELEIAELEQNTVRAQAQSMADNLTQRIGDFDARISASSREMQQIPPRVSEEGRRKREVDISTNLYSSLQAEYEKAKLAELSASPDVRALDMAVPPTTPVVDRLLFIIAGGLFGGLGLGIVLSLLLDRFDHRIRYPEQVTRELGLRILGALPLVATNKGGQPDPDGLAFLQESLRSIRMNMVYAHGVAGPFITTITSPGPGEGKSFFSTHLAKSFADTGHKVLVIDGDTRRGSLHRTLGGFRKPGLLDLLAGTASLEQVMQTIPSRGVDFIGCGGHRAGGPELLASSTMAQLLAGLRSRYSVILIDSPPLGAGVDPLVLGALTGSLVLLLRNGVTDRELAGAKLEDLQRLPIRMLGAVLNDVKPQGAYRYYSYLPGYRAEDEVEEQESPKARSKGSLLGRG